MPRFGFKTIFSKLFASVMFTLVVFAIAMIALTHLVHDNSASTRWQVLATQIVNQIDPFVDELDNSITANDRLQARFMLAVIKKSFDIFDESLEAKMGLYDREGGLLIQTDESDLPKELPEDPMWITQMMPTLSAPDSHYVQAVSDRGYTLLYQSRNPPKHAHLSAMLNLFTGTVLLLMIMTLLLWWIAHSMTWRINKMSGQMAQLGEGDFSVRVPVSGSDEVAKLARGFNQSAQKIEQLINANSLLLAHASHELRTPITRIRLQTEMMHMLAAGLPDDIHDKFIKRIESVNRDLTGLNDLVESILLVSRLDAGHATEQIQTFDLYQLVQTECQHYPQATLLGESISMTGQAKLIVHLVRNLLNNAMIHGVPPILVQVYGVQTAKEADTPPADLTATCTTCEQTEETMGVDSANGANPDQKKSADVSAFSNSTTVSASHTVDNVVDSGLASSTAKNPVTSKSSNKEPIKGDHVAKSVTRPFIQPTQPVSSHRSVMSYLKTQQALLKASHKNDTASVAKSSAPHGQAQEIQDPDLQSETASPSLAKRLRHATTKSRLNSKKEAKKDKPIEPPNFAVIAVMDKGTGIPLDKRQEIFSPFVRLQQQKKGSGLGLSLVAQIVESHGGSIKTDTFEEHTRFLVTLPIQPQDPLKKPH